MVDFHVMLSSEFAGDGMDAASALRYASLAGLRFIGLTIPCDGADLSRIGPLAAHVRRLSLYANVEARTGVELRHVPPALLPEQVKKLPKCTPSYHLLPSSYLHRGGSQRSFGEGNLLNDAWISCPIGSENFAAGVGIAEARDFVVRASERARRSVVPRRRRSFRDRRADRGQSPLHRIA